MSMPYHQIKLMKCDGCSSLIKEEYTSISNSMLFGVPHKKYWSDGKVATQTIASILASGEKDDLVVAKCPHCAKILWLDELEIVTQSIFPSSLTDDSNTIENTKPIKELSFFEYIDVAEQETNTNKIKFCRWRVWQLGNDRRRTKSNNEIALNEFEISNLNKLLDLLSSDTANEILLKAEIYRELGDFTKSLEVLEYLPAKERNREIYTKIFELNHAREVKITVVNEQISIHLSNH